MQTRPLTLNIIGAGRLGKTLARLWQDRGIFSVAGLCNRSRESTQAAVDFIGAGDVYSDIMSMPEADCWLIATGDNEIATSAHRLAERFSARGSLKGTTAESRPLIFHCSGALPAAALNACRPAAIASAHPVHSFADPERSLTTLQGSTVALEGDDTGTQVLRGAFAMLGCDTLSLSPEQKLLYHTGSVMACNYLTVLLDLSLQTLAAAGIDEQTARKLLEPIVTQTVRNNFALGPAHALTGPVARGDAETVQKQLQALQKTDRAIAEIYRQLGLAGVELAQKTDLSDNQANQLQSILREQAK
ncbi:Rossmann-like and DUF2520 domain-containing protein [Microbulbifer sp. SA54]|uniref:Rossmann-like and DUF2520 domain-containing protein n=1 Tax=Microbulbifer sp. SA54 TaxID=3401577 RepID=UPI003AB0AAEA